jgi:hypothetical protein
LRGSRTGGLREHPALANVVRLDGHERIAIELPPPCRKEARRLPQPRPIERVAHGPRIGEVRLRSPQRYVLRKCSSRGDAEPVLHAVEHSLRDGQQLVFGIVRKVDVMRDARRQPGIGTKERVHPVLVTGDDDHQVVALTFHHLQQDFDRLLPVVALVFRTIEVVGLVDEQHAAHRLLQYLLRLGRRMPDILTDEVVPGDGNEVALADEAQAMQDFGHPHCHRGLARARIAGKRHVQRWRSGRQAQRRARALDQQQRRNVADSRLDGRQPDQFKVEVLEHLADLRIVEHRLQVDAIRRPVRRWPRCRFHCEPAACRWRSADR